MLSRCTRREFLLGGGKNEHRRAWTTGLLADLIDGFAIDLTVHLAGGRRWRGRVLDDHLHPVPDAVFALLEELAARAPGPLDVIIERDGSFPPFAELLAELDRARA